MLKNDHKTVRQLGRDFQRAGNKSQKSKLAQQIVEELTVHAFVEEEVFYPAMLERLPKLEETLLEAFEEHHVAKWLCAEVASMKPDEERFDAKVMVLVELVRHHVEEEEGELFPKIRKELGRKELTELAAEMEQIRKKAPRSPRPEPAVRG